MTNGTIRAAARVRSPLTDLENEVMQAVWRAAPCSVEAAHHAVGVNRGLKETSVRTVLRRLEKKGYLRHESVGRAYVYMAVEPARNLAARAVRQIVDRLCRGSVEDLVAGMVEAKVLKESELDSLERYVRSRAQSRRRK
jgi:BlaI family transcriptional regulator, penicillinase repressor